MGLGGEGLTGRAVLPREQGRQSHNQTHDGPGCARCTHKTRGADEDRRGVAPLLHVPFAA